MPRSAASIAAELAVIDAHLSSVNSLIASTGSDATSVMYADRAKLSEERRLLQAEYDRVTRGSMFARTRITGIGGV